MYRARIAKNAEVPVGVTSYGCPYRMNAMHDSAIAAYAPPGEHDHEHTAGPIKMATQDQLESGRKNWCPVLGSNYC